MAEPVAPAAAEPTAADEVYRPLSGLAIASFGVASIYAAYLSVIGTYCLLTRSPLFLSPWTVMFPVSGLLLALAARQHLRYAEGTRSGEVLATWGLRLSIGFGAAYLAYHMATFWALKLQAEKVVDGWFQKIRKGETAAAFLETRQPLERAGDDPSDLAALMARYGRSPRGQRGPLPLFQESDLVTHARNAGTEFSLNALGVRDIDYDTGSYRVTLSYRLHSADGDFDLVVTARTKESPPPRAWMISLDNGETRIDKVRYSPLGMANRQWRAEATRFAADVATKRSMNDTFGIFLVTRPLSERPRLAGQIAGLAAMQLGSATCGPLGLLINVGTATEVAGGIPSFGEFLNGGLISSENLVDTENRKAIVADASKLFRPETMARLRTNESPSRMSILPDERLRCEHDMELMMISDNPALPSQFVVEGRLVMESDGAPPTPESKVTWRLVRFELIRSGKPPPAEPGNR